MQNHHRRKFVINMAAHFATLTLLLISLSFPGIEEVTNFRSKNVVGFHFLKKKKSNATLAHVAQLVGLCLAK